MCIFVRVSSNKIILYFMLDFMQYLGKIVIISVNKITAHITFTRKTLSLYFLSFRLGFVILLQQQNDAFLND